MAKSRAINPSKQPHPQPQIQPQRQIISQQWSGPLPPPAALEHFNEIIPNGAERIMAMIEREQAHRIEHDTSALEGEKSDTKRGHHIGAAACLLAICGAIFTAYIGAHPSVSVALVSVPILGMIQAFVGSKKK